jgi:hypothetical protein
MHNMELQNLYSASSVNIIEKLRRMRVAGHVARMGRTGNAYVLLVGKSKGKLTTRKTKM